MHDDLAAVRRELECGSIARGAAGRGYAVKIAGGVHDQTSGRLATVGAHPERRARIAGYAGRARNLSRT